MGSMITLGIGRMEIDWGKNNVFTNHSILFTENDVKQIPYYYIDNDTGKEIVEYKEGLSCKLSIIKKRLNFIGYSIPECNEKYNELLKDCSIHKIDINMDFDSFKTIIGSIDINKIDTPLLEHENYDNEYDLGEFLKKCILGEKEIRDKFSDYYSDGIETFLENLDVYIILRLIAENNNLQDLDVYWNYIDVVESGWVTREEILNFSQNDHESILLVTEGTSDTFILKKTINTLYPELSHMFNFIDMQGNYPFTGTGNLYNFCCGLIKIGILNKMIIIFDNDTAGLEKYEKLIKVPKPHNLLITKLPDHDNFTSMKTIGPQGISVEDINGLAVSIECFLDFKDHNPQVRWTSYNDKIKEYQGALINKDNYISDFKKANLLDGSYNTEKLIYLIEYIFGEWEKNKSAVPTGTAD